MLSQLKKLRKSKCISQQKLADAIGTSQQAINRYENQDIEPDIETLIKLADYFEVSLDYLVARQAQFSNSPDEVRLHVSFEEMQLLEEYRILSSAKKQVIKDLIHSYHES